MEGIKETKEVLDFVVSLAGALASGLEDGKLELVDALGFLPALTKAPAAFGDVSKVPAEFKDMSDEERQALLAYAKAELDFSDDELEQKVELGLQVALYLGQLVAGFKK